MANSSVTNTFVVETVIDPDTVNENFGDLVDFNNTSVVHRDGTKAMTGAFDAGSQKIVNVQSGTAVTDGANIGNVDAVLPVGMMTAYGGSSAPSKWLICNGAAVSRVTYSALFTVVGTAFGAGDGSTTFNLPNMENKYPIGKSSTVALGASVGSNNAVAVNHGHGDNFSASSSGGSHGHGHTISANQSSHTHSAPNFGSGTEGIMYHSSAYSGHDAYVPVDSSKTATAPAGYANGAVNYTAALGSTDSAITISGSVSTDTSHSHTITVSGSVTDYTSEAGTDKNRPASVGVNWIIRTGV